MADYSDLQQVLYNKTERLYREYRDASGVLTDPTTPFVRVYNPEGILVSSGTPIKESVGVYYHSVTIGTAGSVEGIYQAYWEGTMGGALVTMDVPQFFYLTKYPWQASKQDAFAHSIRRMIGDTNPNNYRISIPDMYYFIQDAVDQVQSQIDFGYVLTVAPTSLTWNQSLASTPSALFKLKCVILIMQATMHDNLYDGGMVQVGDIKVDVTGMLRLRMENILRVSSGSTRIFMDIAQVS